MTTSKQALRENAPESSAGASPVLARIPLAETSAVAARLRAAQESGSLPEGWRPAWGAPAPGDREVALYALDNRLTALSGKKIREVKVAPGTISLTFDGTAAEAWQEATRRNLNRFVAIVIDGAVYQAPRVASEIRSGKVQITGQFREVEVKMLASIIRGGALPLDLAVVK